MSKEEQKQSHGRDPEATLVKPFFSEASEETAQPVVPLSPEAVPGETGGSIYVPVPPVGAARRSDGRRRVAFTLVVVSLLAGLAAGFAGSMIYLRSRASEEQPAMVEQTPAAPQVSSPTTTEPAAVPATSTTSTSEPAPPALADARDESRKDEKIQPQPPTDARRADEKSAATNDDRRDDGRASATRPRRVEDDGDDDIRGRRNESEAAERRRPTPPGVYDTQGPSPEGSEAERRAEREERRLRRAERQRRREDRRRRGEDGREERAVDSVRGIFEGQPPE